MENHFIKTGKRRAKVALLLIKYYFRVRGKDCVLADTPTHGNLGDHAITLAQQQLLHEPGMTYGELTASEMDGREKYYASMTPRSCFVAVPGGGFLGMLWPEEEYRFRRILEAFRDHRVMVFPQTVTFDLTTEEGRAFFAESKAIYSAHKDLTIFVREARSYAFMRENMPDVRVVLAPDVVTYFHYLEKEDARSGFLLCLRSDLEKAVSGAEAEAIRRSLHHRYPQEPITYTDTNLYRPVAPEDRAETLSAKLRAFASSKLVVTDRLHGMVFAAITNTPCLALGNCNGKVKGVYQWIKDNPYIRYVDNVDTFEDELQKLDLTAENAYQYGTIDSAMQPLKNTLANMKTRRR